MKKSLAVAVVAANLMSSAWAQQAPRVVTVTGQGSVQVAPDKATVTYQFIDEVRLPATGQLASAKPNAAVIPQLVAKNKARTEPAVRELKQLIGADGTVEVMPSVQRLYEYDQKTGRNNLVGYKVVHQVQVCLEGRQPIEAKLGGLFDSSKIGADEMGEPVMGLQEATRLSAARQANEKAVDDAVATANSQLEKGEGLGAALQRGERVNVPAPRPYAAARMESAMADAPGGGQALVETGKIAVTSVIHFVFEVVGTPARLGAQAGQAAAAPAGK